MSETGIYVVSRHYNNRMDDDLLDVFGICTAAADEGYCVLKDMPLAPLQPFSEFVQNAEGRITERSRVASPVIT